MLVTGISAFATLAWTPPAHAADASVVVQFGNPPVWKAYGQHDDAGNRICARAYNSTADARASTLVKSGAQIIAVAIDRGGDDQRTCTSVSIDGVDGLTLRVEHEGATGVVHADQVSFNG